MNPSLGASHVPVEGWGELPDGHAFGEVAAVGVDTQDRVYVFTRGAHPMIVFDRDGRYLRSWGHGVFRKPHGLHVGPDDCLYCTDEGDHTVRKFDPSGRLLLEIGVAGVASERMSGLPFHRCTHTALAPDGSIYVSDGYGNACIHKYSAQGKLLKTWGGPGTGPGSFNIPHNICCDAQGWVYVADRENHRIQVFDGEGRYETQWTGLHRPCALCMHCRAGAAPLFYVGEMGPGIQFSNRDWPHIGPRVSVLDAQGRLRSRFGDKTELSGTSRFIAPHGIAVDSTGAIYVGEVATSSRRNAGIHIEGSEPRCLQKFTLQTDPKVHDDR